MKIIPHLKNPLMNVSENRVSRSESEEISTLHCAFEEGFAGLTRCHSVVVTGGRISTHFANQLAFRGVQRHLQFRVLLTQLLSWFLLLDTWVTLKKCVARCGCCDAMSCIWPYFDKNYGV